MFKLLPKSKYPTGMLHILTEHTLIMYVQYKRFQEKNFISFREIVRERLSTFRFRQHFKRLKFDYLSSETVSNKRIKNKNCFLNDCVSWSYQI